MPLYRGHHPFPLRLCQSAFAPVCVCVSLRQFAFESVCDSGSERLGSTACRRSPWRITNSTKQKKRGRRRRSRPIRRGWQKKKKKKKKDRRTALSRSTSSFSHSIIRIHSVSGSVGQSVSQSFLPSIAVRIIIVPTFKPGLLRSNCCCACPRHPGASQADQALISDSGTEDCLPAQGHRRMGAEDSRAEKSS